MRGMTKIKKVKIISSGIIFLSLFFILLQEASFGFDVGRGLGDLTNFAGPTLLYPTADNIILAPGAELVFRWRQTDEAMTDYYIFKLYKGYGTGASSLMMKKEIRHQEYPFKLPAEGFEDGQVYTWSLVQVFLSGRKSDVSFASFRLVKEGCVK